MELSNRKFVSPRIVHLLRPRLTVFAAQWRDEDTGEGRQAHLLATNHGEARDILEDILDRTDFDLVEVA